MATNFPTGLDTLTNPTSTDEVATVDHAAQHANVNDAVEALEAKVGIDGSAVTTSHDYKLSDVTSTAKAVSTAGNQTIAGNKTFTGTTTTAGLEAGSGDINTTGDISGTTATLTNADLTNLRDSNSNESVVLTATASAVNYVNVVNAASGNDVAINAAGDDTDVGITISPKGAGTVTVDGFVIPTADGSDGDFMKTNGSGVLSFVAPSSITSKPNTIPLGTMTGRRPMHHFFTDDGSFFGADVASTDNEFYFYQQNGQPQYRAFSSETASTGKVYSCVKLGAYVYVLGVDDAPATDDVQVWRYSASDLTSSPTEITFSGAVTLTDTNSVLTMTSDGTDIYISYAAGSSANQYDIAKYTISGSTFTYDSTITLAGTPTFDGPGTWCVTAAGNFYVINTSNVLIKYNSSGAIQWTSSTATWNSALTHGASYGGTLYLVEPAASAGETYFDYHKVISTDE